MLLWFLGGVVVVLGFAGAAYISNGLGRRVSVLRRRAFEERARAEEEEKQLLLKHSADRTALMARRVDSSDVVEVGTNASGPYLLNIREVGHGWLLGGTGSGKSRLAAAFLRSVASAAAKGVRTAIILLDFKGDDLAQLVLRSIAAGDTPVTGELIVTRPFATDFIPELNILEPVPGVPLLTQASAVAEALAATAMAEFGIRQRTAATYGLAVAIEHGMALTAVPTLLRHRPLLLELGAASQDQQVRDYFGHSFDKECTDAVLLSVISRVEELLRIDSLRVALGAKGCQDWARSRQPGSVSITDLGGSLMASNREKTTVATFLLTKLMWSIFASGQQPTDCLTIIMIDEVQLALASEYNRDAVIRLLTVGRSAQVQLHLIHQASVQLPAELRELLNGNCGLRMMGRASETDAKDLVNEGWVGGELLKEGPVHPHGKEVSRTEAVRAFTREVANLPRRRFVIAERGNANAATIIKAPEYSPAEWHDIDPHVAASTRQGATGIPLEELRLRQAPLPRTLSRLPALPNVVSSPKGARRRVL